MMDIVEAVRGIALEELSNFRMPQLGVVTSVFPHSDESDKDNYECNVRLSDPDLELRKVQIATQVIGLAGIPRVGDLVLVIFVNGDINSPIVIGRLYNDEDRPPVNKAEEVVYVAPHAKNPDVRRVYLEFPEGMKFCITDEEVNLEAGKTTVTIQKDGDVTIKSEANVTIAADGDATIKSKGDMSISGSSVKIESDKGMNIQAGSNFKMHAGTDMAMEADKGTEIKSNTLSMETTGTMQAKAQSAMQLESGGNYLVKASGMVNIESKAMVKIKGTAVNIN